MHDGIRSRTRCARSEESFRLLADHAPVMIWTTDADGLVTFVNNGWLEFTGTTLEEELGETWALGVHPKTTPGGCSTAGTRRWPCASRGRWSTGCGAATGDYRWIVDRGVPRYSEKGEFSGYVGTATDIHERKQMEEALRRVYEREHRVAETLQRSLLPEKLPDIEGVTLAARYLPAGAGAAVGGDWYDATELPDGRVALVVGDVVGHGLRAAAVMGQLRNASRAYSIIDTSPAEIVARLNRLVTTGEEGVMATVLYLALDRDTGEVTYASAGHPPPLLLTAEGPRYLEGGRSVPVGAADLVTFREESTHAAARRDPAAVHGRAGGAPRRLARRPLRPQLAAAAASRRRTRARATSRSCATRSSPACWRAPSRPTTSRCSRSGPTRSDANRLDLTLPAEPEVLARLRRRLVRFLHAAGASEEETYEVTLDDLRGGRQRDRARLRPGRRHASGSRPSSRTASSSSWCATPAAGASSAASTAAAG